MENEAAPTGGRLASPEVIGGKSNRHSGEKGAPQAPFFHAFFWVVAGGETCGEPPRRFLRRGGGVGCCGGGDVASGRALRGRFGRKGRGGRPFFMPFLGGGCGRKGCCGAFWAKGRCGGGVCCGGRGEGMAFGRAAGGAAAFARRFLVFGGWSHRFWGRPSFFGGYGGEGGSARERRGDRGVGELGEKGGGEGRGREKREDGWETGRSGGEEGKRKKRSAKLPNASYGGSFVLRRGCWNKRSICGSTHYCFWDRAKTALHSWDWKGL